MFSPPVPCAAKFAATVPCSGLRAMHTGSHAGFKAVPPHSPLWLFGNPLPYSQPIWSRISNPASSMATAMR